MTNLMRPIPIVVVDASAMVEVLAGKPDWIDRLGRWQSDGTMLVAPAHFGPEMANALLLGVHLEEACVFPRPGTALDIGL